MSIRLSVLLIISILLLGSDLDSQVGDAALWGKKEVAKYQKEVRRVPGLKGWVSVPSGTLSVHNKNGSGRDIRITISNKGMLVLDHEVSVGEYKQFLSQIVQAEPDFHEDVVPHPEYFLGLPEDLYQSKEYNQLPAVGLMPKQIALFCLWYEYKLLRGLSKKDVPLDFSTYLDGTHWIESPKNGSFLSLTSGNLDSLSFSLGSTVSLTVTKYNNAYLQGHEVAYDFENSDKMQQHANSFDELESVFKMPRNKYGLRGMGTNAAEPYKIMGLVNVSLDTVQGKTSSGHLIQKPLEPIRFVSLYGFKPEDVSSLVFIDPADEQKPYAFRLMIYVPYLFEDN